MMPGLRFESTASTLAVISAATVAAAASFHLIRSAAARQRKDLLILRAAGAVCLILAILAPTIVLVSNRLAKPRLQILIDGAPSMGVKSGAESRLGAAAHWLLSNRRAIEKNAEPELIFLGDDQNSLSSIKYILVRN